MSYDFNQSLAKPGQRLALPLLHGSADAYALATAAAALKAQQRMLTVFVANPGDAQRLLAEIPWFNAELRCHLLPDWETLPYDAFSPHQDLVSERLASLYEIQNGNCDVLLAPATTALLRMAPPAFLAAYTFFFKKGDTLDEAKLKTQLTLAGYGHVHQVMSPGEYSVRGGLIDLFPMGSPLPYRLDLFGDTIESIRTFDADTQRSLYPVPEVRLLPGREFPMDEAARTAFRSRWRERFEGDPSRSSIYKDISNGIPSAGIEYYLPLFFDDTASLFDYLPAEPHFALIGNVDDAIARFWTDTRSRYQFLKADRERPVLAPETVFLRDEDFFTALKGRARWAVAAVEKGAAASEISAFLPDIAVNRRADDPLTNLRAFLLGNAARVLICAETLGRRETLQQYFNEFNLQPTLCEGYADFITGDAKLMLGVAPLHSGFQLGQSSIFITEAELYAGSGKRIGRKKQEAPTEVEHMVRDLSELKIGDPVVHSNHGIGRYMGLISMDLGEGDTEFLYLEYAKDTKLYVPVAQLHVISRYSGAAPEDAPLHSLGSGQWEKAKRKAAQQIRDTAAELLNLYARRAARLGHAFDYSVKDYQAFADSFGFEETPDQAAAIRAVIDDMVSGKPMDRLICGDVGFGKTEVALRAAFVAVMGGKQVAILAPTTLLAEQHAQTFADRFANWPVKIAELSRFRSGKEINLAIKGMGDGTVDIVIGTHKLLSADVKFSRLGLVIIDEEHRFGVRQKEALKSLRAEVDVLTLTATPIPRTLGMALEGLRDFSIIATAPQKRLAIKTFVRSEDNSVIREACLRELKRGGQVYFLHNEVETIQNRKAMLEALLPEARVVVAHGQMHERDLEKVMRDFVAQRHNILLCTTIIETGIDVPTANTIIMHRADKFGLAQLHQLRGRVGRSHHQAYAYLLVHDVQSLTKQAGRRLEAIQQMEELGSGFYLAMHDLEIRGAGEVLGDNQSGEMHEIGFQMYSDMLSEAVRCLKNGKEPDLAAPLASTTEINLHIPALLPNDFCGDVHERLSIYKRLANCSKAAAIDDMQEEMIDRFGKLPEQVKALLETHRLRVAAKPLGILKIDAHGEAATLQFEAQPPIDAMRIIELVQKNKHIRLNGQDKLRITANMPDLASRVAQLKLTLKALHS
ncbi:MULTISPECIES: transcription-repair coupling factor [unclassified Undibacterium]|uniref:transcription-repair coupling factor n=1 Tax=unclassified Undibacterium TaxID=2630295 RepID=UPI002AC9CA11|nr:MULTISPECIES: transcription-repair coupling factor [unclassified Undibacterium]MEB0138605.1 transcription-repair coupling factor [Undibacterium sp. CCC2.1]MEB0171331.1 transcription-repair coupling factor [Undibacterium sp. CCC1.1]MEB0175369.1 transcription-repair coupling factor [Undibacterium sp. CCC3.4]MEB0214527.1 transcription-repair coupling factor [Undibacterium sp. 5I2]WPX43099.1 transcription-repair coupling factor [Undibacterium sp. CCC3.4]